MKYIGLLIIFVLLTSSLSQPCASTCQEAACPTNNLTFCNGCDPGLSFDPTGQCLPIPPYTQIILIFNNNTASSSYISSIAAENGLFYSPNLNQIFFPTYFMLPEGTGNVLGFYFQNIPTNYQLQLRATGYIDFTISGCIWNYYSVTWGGCFINQYNLSQQYFTLVVNFTGGPGGNADIQIINQYSSGSGACQNMYFNQFTLIGFLCNTTCTACLSYSFCTSCGMQTGVQTYLQSSFGTCSYTCLFNYYQNAPDFICDVCDVSCAYCNGTSVGFCISCNNNLGYVQSYTSGTTCLYTCPPGQYKDIGLQHCLPCNANCLTCDGHSANCTTCAFSTAGGQLQLSNGQCVINCPSATFVNTTVNDCSPCDSSCSVCWGSANTQCSRCTNITIAGNTIIYYLAIGTTVCSDSCPQGQYIDITIPNYCQQCSSLCIYCQNNSHTCINNVCPLGFFFYNNACMSVCIQGTFPNVLSSQCQPCATGCNSCTGSTLNDCSSCGAVSTSIVYYLSYGTTSCVTACPSGQYSLTNNLCYMCDPSCATCQGVSTNCTSCTSANVVILLYFFNSTCVSVCPNNTYPSSLNPLNNTCSNCSQYCSVCFGPSLSNCTVCQNYTSVTPVVTIIYYKDLNSNTCNYTCPNGQYINKSLPNVCNYCNNTCFICTSTANTCLACVSGYFLYSPTTNCYVTCPAGYFGNTTTVLVNGVKTMRCSACNQICFTCINSTSSDCLSCHNITSAGITTMYFKNSANNTCIKTCPAGYVENILTNNCDPCQQGCAECEFNASYCTQCQVTLGIIYFLPISSKSCVDICPDGTFGNTTDFLCYPCQYFTLNGQCLTTCPTGYVGIVGNSSTCVLCNQTNHSCSSSSQFTVQTTVSKDGKQFNHIIQPQLGISPLSTADILANGLKVYVITNSRRRLLTSVPLQIEGVSISSDGTRIIILTNYYPIELNSGSSIQVNFRVGALLSADGIAYNSIAGTFSLNDSSFLKSYFLAFGEGTSPQTEGIIFIAVGFLFLLMALIFSNIRAINECLSLIQLLQLIGLCRLRYFPIVFNYYNSLVGFSYFELLFLPNGFSYLFPQFYTQSTVDSVIFTYGTNNFILNFGSVFQFYIPLQIGLLAFFIYHRQNEQKIKYGKILQQALLMLWSLLLIFGSILALMSLEFNNISNANPYFLSSLLISSLILVGYTFYFVFWVRTCLFLQLYKINNIFRLISIFLLFYNLNAALIAFNLNEIIFIIIDMVFFRTQKRNKWLYVIERILIIILMNSVMLLSSSSTFLVLVGTCLGILFIFQFYLLFMDILEYFHKKEADRLEMEASVSINMSTSQKHSFQPKIMSAKINDSQHFMTSQIYQKQLQGFTFKTQEIDPPVVSLKQQYLKKSESESQVIFDQNFTPKTQKADEVNEPNKQARRRLRRTELKLVQKVEPSKQREDIEMIKIGATSQINSNIEIIQYNQDNSQKSEQDKKSALWQTSIPRNRYQEFD